jgi:hypothetical protein
MQLDLPTPVSHLPSWGKCPCIQLARQPQKMCFQGFKKISTFSEVTLKKSKLEKEFVKSEN